MKYFSIHCHDHEHIGFLIMLPDNEHDYNPQSGQFVLKIQNEHPSKHHSLIQDLEDLQNPHAGLRWQIDKDKVVLSNPEGDFLGSIRQECLSIRGHSLLINDLTGTL